MDLRKILTVKVDATDKGSQPTTDCHVGDVECKKVA